VNSGRGYLMMLQDILKHTERAGEDTKDLQRALEVMCIIPKAANDMMNVGRLQGFEVREFAVLIFRFRFCDTCLLHFPFCFLALLVW